MAKVGDFPCDGEWLTASEGNISSLNKDLGDVALTLAGEWSLGNEVHDCQRLILTEGGTLRFGPLVGVYPINTNLQHELGNTPKVVASIVRWTPGEYEPLNLVGAIAISCLWLLPPVQSGSQWTAEIIPYGSVPCPQQQNLFGSAISGPGDLAVRVTPPSPAGAYAATARWGWDEEGSQHYIGFRCGESYCTVGKQGFTPKEGEQLAAAPNLSVLPGWYDYQILAVPDNEEGIIPGPMGRIMPVAPLQTWDAEWNIADDGTPLPALQIDVLGDTAHVRIYVEKFNLTLMRSMGQIGPLGIPGPGQAWASGRVALAQHPDGTWQARFLGSGNGATVRVQDRVEFLNLGHAAMGAVRWRWRDFDEEIWVSCRQGCCWIDDL